MQYACEEFPRSRVDVVGMDNFMDKPSMGDDDILWSVEEREDDVVFTLVDRGSLTPDGVRANTLSRRYGWRTRWLPLPSVEPLPYPEWRAYFVDPTKPDFAFEHMQAHNV